MDRGGTGWVAAGQFGAYLSRELGTWNVPTRPLVRPPGRTPQVCCLLLFPRSGSRDGCQRTLTIRCYLESSKCSKFEAFTVSDHLKLPTRPWPSAAQPQPARRVMATERRHGVDALPCAGGHAWSRSTQSERWRARGWAIGNRAGVPDGHLGDAARSLALRSHNGQSVRVATGRKALAGLGVALGAAALAILRPRTPRASHDTPAPVAIGRSQLRLWVRIAWLAGAILMFAWSWALIPYRDSHPPARLQGGLMLMTNAEVDGNGLTADPPRAEVDVSFIDAAAEGFDWIDLELTVAQGDIGDRWYVVTSGQYETPEDAPDWLFCTSADQVRRVDEGVNCDDGVVSSSIEYRFEDRVGVVDGSDSGDILGLSDYETYDDESASVVTGVLAEEGSSRIDIPLPIHALEPTRVGGSEYWQIASPSGGDFGDFGGFGTIGELEHGPSRGRSALASVSEKRAIDPLTVTSMQVTLAEPVGARVLEASDPPTASSGAFLWRSDGPIGDIEFFVRDPFAERADGSSVFLAGVLISTAVGSLFLLLEQSIRR